MPAQNSPVKTKSLLFDLTSQILEGKPEGSGVLSSEVVREFLRIHHIPPEEAEEITRIGLMVLAGKVTTMNRTKAGQLDIFERERFPLFVDLRILGEDGKYHTRRYAVKKLTPNVIIKHSATQTKNKSISKRNSLITWAQKRIESGHGEVAVKDSD